ncbi:MAG: methyltransferase [Acidobacteria bacterium]|nr:methyltransferase [Acidobacteriota bacterium]
MTAPLDLKGLQDLLWNFAGHRTVTTAAKCGILGRLARSPATVYAVSEDLGLAPEACDKVMRALVALGVLECDEDTFRLAPELEPLFGQGPDDLAPFLKHSHQMYENWGENLETWLRTGSWPRREKQPEEILNFAKAMRGVGIRTAKTVVDHIDLSGVRSMLDIGGSLGHWAQVICEKVPGVSATVFDIPETAVAGRELYLGTEFEARIEFVGGDYLSDDFGPGFDLVLIANVLHQEMAEQASDLIRRAAEALTPGGRLCVLDFQIDPDRCGPELGTLFAIHMRDFGDTWTENDIRTWMAAAGLNLIERTDVGPTRWIITGYKP